MILTCNSCNKKFVVPDSAITPAGRMVQCGSCGNKWRQFPSVQSKKVSVVSKIQKKLLKKVNQLGQVINNIKNEIVFYIYDNGCVESKFIID